VGLASSTNTPSPLTVDEISGTHRTDGVTEYTLVLVLPGRPYSAASDDIVDARTWLADSVRDVPADLGVAVSLDAYGDDAITLHYLEGSYSVDVSKLSWRPNKPGPAGAV
jgi:hypothetical protein